MACPVVEIRGGNDDEERSTLETNHATRTRSQSSRTRRRSRPLPAHEKNTAPWRLLPHPPATCARRLSTSQPGDPVPVATASPCTLARTRERIQTSSAADAKHAAKHSPSRPCGPRRTVARSAARSSSSSTKTCLTQGPRVAPVQGHGRRSRSASLYPHGLRGHCGHS